MYWACKCSINCSSFHHRAKGLLFTVLQSYVLTFVGNLGKMKSRHVGFISFLLVLPASGILSTPSKSLRPTQSSSVENLALNTKIFICLNSCSWWVMSLLKLQWERPHGSDELPCIFLALTQILTVWENIFMLFSKPKRDHQQKKSQHLRPGALHILLYTTFRVKWASLKQALGKIP